MILEIAWFAMMWFGLMMVALVLSRIRIHADPVSLILIPHLDRIYGGMWRLIAPVVRGLLCWAPALPLE